MDGMIDVELADLRDALAVERRDDRTWTIDLHPRWAVAHRPHGGYMLAVMCRAAAQAVSSSDRPVVPIAASAHFLAVPEVGPVVVDVEVLRHGRSTSQVAARLRQDDEPCVVATVTLTSLSDQDDPHWEDASPPQLPAFEDCIRLPVRRGKTVVPVWDAVELRIDPATAGWTERRPGGEAESRGWLAFAGGRVDTSSLLIAADVLPAVTLELGSRGWVPTFELTVYIRAEPAPGRLRLRQRARLVQGGFVDQTCDVWDSQGRLVVQAVQLAGVRFPEPDAAPTLAPERRDA